MSAGSRMRAYARDAGLPALIAASASAGFAGLIDGAINTYSPLQALATAGFVSMVALPIGFVIALLGHWLWAAWGLAEKAEKHGAETGGVPLLAAWLVCAFAGLGLLAAMSLELSQSLIYKNDNLEVIAALYTAIMVVGALVAAATALPAVNAMTRLLTRLDSWIHASLGRSVMTPRLLLVQTIAATIGLLALVWFVSIEPRIGFLDLTPYLYLCLWLGTMLGIRALWPALRRNSRVTIAVTTLALGIGASSISAAYYVRHSKPYSMLEVWGNTTWGGAAIDYMYDIQTLRRSLNLKGIEPKARPGASHPNVVLITIDTLRADRTPAYGGPAKMPSFAKLARQGAVFEWAFSPGNVTRRSLPSIVTGLSPHRVRGRVAGWALRLDPRHIAVAERFRAAGYETAGFLAPGSQFHPDHRLGLIRGLDYLHYTNAMSTKPDGDLGALAADWIKKRRGAKPFFIWIHYIDPHLWDVTYRQAKFGRDMRARYDRALADVDASLKKLMAVIWTDEMKKKTLVAISADHGEGLGDRGQRFHSTNLYNSQIRVPLVVTGAGIKPRRIRRSTGLVDLAPTLLDLAGYQPPGMPQMDGVSLAPIILGKRGESKGEAYSAMVRDRSVRDGVRALVWGRYKLIEFESNKADVLYDIRVDKRERRNLALHQPALLKQLKKRLNERRRIDAISPF